MRGQWTRTLEELVDGKLEALVRLVLTRELQELDDGSAVVDWRDSQGPLALLSAKRIEPGELAALADAIAAGTVEGELHLRRRP